MGCIVSGGGPSSGDGMLRGKAPELRDKSDSSVLRGSLIEGSGCVLKLRDSSWTAERGRSAICREEVRYASWCHVVIPCSQKGVKWCISL